ncbi:UDP-glycosyltransferase 86a1 [Phtheirospermum japonicum]|uniref:Glycosyltransferase n=1 Tax=Phtheirospermum japonicum TaxID=374723 RepID=A0A830BT18_9LAMI|nr:UDP-glycosyltransferase 86a1 [Phtheirospermum japonicum]
MVEFLFQGHINPFINLAIGLASKGCTVTYVQTEFNQHLISKARAADPQTPEPDSGLDIRFTTISDGFPLDFDRELNFVEFYESILRDFPAIVDDFVGKILEPSSRSFVVADSNYLWLPAVAAKYDLPAVSFWPSPALRLSVGYHLELLKEKGLFCSYDYNADIHEHIPGVKLTDVKDFITYFLAEDDEMVPPVLREGIMKAQLEVRKADFILYNTVQELEVETLSALDQELPSYAVGPTNFLPHPINTAPIIRRRSLRHEVDCNQWLGSKPPGSVLFVSFGSLAQTSKQVIREIARGLQASRVNFVWVLHPDAAVDGFEDDIADRGLIIPWCNQCTVLSNPAIGGFLTHCGWSSILESIWFGVPMICYPIFTDQPTNRNMVVNDWKVGINLCDEPPISREEVARKVGGLMCGNNNESDELNREMKKTSEIVHNAVAANGSSDRNLDRFLLDLEEKIRLKEQGRVKQFVAGQ